MFEALQSRWNDSSAPSRILAGVAVFIILAIAVWLCFWALHTDYQVLFADLDPQDAAQMVEELDKNKIDYKLEEGGTTILVDAEEVHRTRLQLMGKGMNLRGTVGFEVFNENDFGTSEFAQKVNFQRALQGELARTIMAFEEVKAARVHLVMPEQGLFRKNNGRAKASVSIVTKGDTRLSPEQIAGIQRLVAASVPEIDPAAVTVIDHRGVALTAHVVEDTAMPGAGARIALKKDIEAYVGRKIALLLDDALGPGKAIVSVDVALNYDQVKTTREDVVAADVGKGGEVTGVMVRKRQSQSGPDTARSDGQVAASASVRDMTSSSSMDVEYQVGRRIEQIVSEPGAIRRVSVGVLLHGEVTPTRMEQIKEVVRMAAGIDAQRGDAIAVHSVDRVASDAAAGLQPVETPVMEVAQTEAGNRDALLGILGVSLAIILVLILVYVAVERYRSGGRGRKLSPEERERMLRQLHDWVAAEGATGATQESR
jgi:flagellar M-ring protein FliF